MDKIFNFKRFRKFLTYDVRTAMADWGVSFLVMAMMPVIWFVISEITSLAAGGHLVPLERSVKLPVFFMTMIVGIISFPVRHYGHITDKRRGSDWLMIPASVFEKFLSMLLICCVVVPVALTGAYALCDWVMTLLPTYGDVTFRLADVLSIKTMSDGDPVISLSVCPAVIFWLNWCESTLVFALGAILFRKAKIPYTILSMFAVMLLISIAVGLVASSGILDFDIADMCARGDLSVKRAATIIKISVNAVYLAVFTILNCSLYFRLKNIRH